MYNQEKFSYATDKQYNKFIPQRERITLYLIHTVQDKADQL